ncbi:MAG: hypothetical protein GX493_01555 [Firmicutes bacterium]|nr:hypothetical protein [Bacillota bacterium]
MRRSVATLAVEEFLTGPGCPFCGLQRETEKRFLGSFFREMVMDGDCRAGLAREGLCTRHLRLIGEAPDKLGAALSLQTLVESAKTRTGRSGCYVCRHIAEALRQYAQIVAELYLEEEGRRKLAEAPAFCLPHTELLLAVEMPRLAGKKTEEFKTFCRERRRRTLASLAEDLARFIRKFDYRMAGEPWNGTEEAVARAVLILTGEEGSETLPR